MRPWRRRIKLLQLDLTNEATNPFYVVLTPDGQLIQAIGGYRKPTGVRRVPQRGAGQEQDQDKGKKVAQADPAR